MASNTSVFGVIVLKKPPWNVKGQVATSTTTTTSTTTHARTVRTVRTVRWRIVRTRPTWNYKEQNKWPGRRCKQGGRKQSPIDIKPRDVITDFGEVFIKYGPLNFRGYNKVLLTGINNGYTLQFQTEGAPSMHPTLTGGPLRNMYRLEQIHLHWMSEHAINGTKFPVEIHLVHIQTHMTINDAMKQKDGLAIVSIFCIVNSTLQGENVSDEHDPPYELMEYIPRLKKTGNRISGLLIDISQLLSTDRTSYYTYSGSLTSPHCNEIVTWIIFQKPIYMSETQHKSLIRLRNGRHNFRSLQKIKYHVVYMPPPNDLSYATFFVVVFEKLVNVIGSFFTNE